MLIARCTQRKDSNHHTHIFSICSRLLFSLFGQKRNATMPAPIIITDATTWLSNHTPTEPPSIDTINITNSISVRDEVGKISDAIRLAEELAGDAKTNKAQTNI